ncbi:GNAT family N-acetyltransferase [Agreia pratensis]|uniref:GNAT family N-acetyltransferase n=1 Tax=Agreia pratensis TaxID=150121 RepID=UPI00188AE207|nr:GNAT family N-acetyltransferase [Agreia pratensis]MBF4633528.1 GNAT family N-acetyltransferase [Agreia pratensis]
MTTFSSPTLRISIATEADRPVLEQLWTMFRHDMSAYSGALPDERGRFRQERLDNALGDSAWRAYVVRLDNAPAGLCIIRNIGSPELVINSFFLVNAARRLGYGRTVVRAITSEHRGRWAVAYQEANTAAAAFWSAIAAEADPGWTCTRASVPERPDVPTDVWIRFTRR